MKKKIFIFGHTGYIGSHLINSLNSKNFQICGYKIPRPGQENLDEFYKLFIEKFLKDNLDIYCIINCAGSIECGQTQDYFFNSMFDSIFQNCLLEKKINIKYLSFNSTKIFTGGRDSYALSKKELEKNFKSVNNFYSLYIDLVFEKNSPHFKTIENALKKIKFLYIPVFFPGKIFYPIDLNSLCKTINEIIFGNYKLNKFIIIGNKEITFNKLIEQVNKDSNLNKKIFYIKSKLINVFPFFIKNYLLKSKSLQQYENFNWLSKLDKDKYLIRKSNNKF